MKVSGIRGSFLTAEEIRIFPAKDNGRTNTLITRDLKVVAIDTEGNIVYSVGVEGGKVVVSYSNFNNDSVTTRAFLYDVLRVAEEVGDKTTEREVKEIIASLIARKFGVPLSLVNFEKVKARLEKTKFTTEEARKVKEFVSRLRRIVIASNKSKEIISAISYQKGFEDAVNIIDRINFIDDRTAVIDDVKVELDDEFNIVAYYDDEGQRVELAEKVHISEFDKGKLYKGEKHTDDREVMIEFGGEDDGY